MGTMAIKSHATTPQQTHQSSLTSVHAMARNRLQVYRENREAAKRNRQAAMELEGRVAAEHAALPAVDVSPRPGRPEASKPPLGPPSR